MFAPTHSATVPHATRRHGALRAADFWLSEFAPARSLRELRARVVRVIDETADTKTFVLRPNRHWTGHRAGQYVTVGVEIDGVRVGRCYSLSSAPSDPDLTITVKRVPGGRVSGWLHDNLRPGSVVRLSPPTGDFVVSEPVPARLLFIGAGSGITPILSMLRDLAARDRVTDATLVYYARSEADVVGLAALRQLATANPGLTLAFVLDDAAAGPVGFDESRFAALVSDFAHRASFVCGPPGLMSRVATLFDAVSAGRNLRSERFVAGPPAPLAAGNESEVAVTLARAGRVLAMRGDATLLEQLEAAGERPASGCRMGICQTCTCRKLSGTVRNLVTGVVSSEPDELIQICISTPGSAVTLAL